MDKILKILQGEEIKTAVRGSDVASSSVVMLKELGGEVLAHKLSGSGGLHRGGKGAVAPPPTRIKGGHCPPNFNLLATIIQF